MSGFNANAGFVTVTIGTNNGLIDNSTKSEYEQDEQFILLVGLRETCETDNLDKYIEFYSRYINDRNIYNYFSYTLDRHSNVFYPSCTCENKNLYCLIKIHKGRYEQSCNCTNGKRYLALRDAYEIELKKKFNEKSCMVKFSISDLLKYFKCNIETFEKSPIIKYIESTGHIDYEFTENI